MSQLEFLTNSEEDTCRLARQIAKIAKVGDIFALNGTLGMGKSVFARAFIKYLTDAQEVPSPTFTLLQIYQAANFDIYHYDLYRIKSPEEIFELGIEEAFYTGVSLIEWPEKMGIYTPKNIIEVNFSQVTNQQRKICINTNNNDMAMRLQSIMVKL